MMLLPGFNCKIASPLFSYSWVCSCTLSVSAVPPPFVVKMVYVAPVVLYLSGLVCLLHWYLAARCPWWLGFYHLPDIQHSNPCTHLISNQNHLPVSEFSGISYRHHHNPVDWWLWMSQRNSNLWVDEFGKRRVL